MKKSDWPATGLAHAAHRLGIPVADVEFLRACGVVEGDEESLERFLAATGSVPDGAAHAVIALRTEWDRALVERGPAKAEMVFGAVELGRHPDGTLVFAVEKALDRIVARNLEVVSGGRVRQLIVDRKLLDGWGARAEVARKRLGQILIELGFVTADEIEAALEQQRREGGARRIGAILVEMKACDGEMVAKAVAIQSGLRYAQLDKLDIPPEVIELVPRELAARARVVPLKMGKRALIVATATPFDFIAQDDLRFQLGHEILGVIASEDGITEALGRYYGAVALDEIEQKMCELSSAEVSVREDLESLDAAAGKGPPVEPHARKTYFLDPQELTDSTRDTADAARRSIEYVNFDEAKAELAVGEEELKGAVSRGELRGFRDGLGMKFKKEDVSNLKAGRETQPSVILTDSDQDLGRPESAEELLLEDSTSDTIVNIGDVMGAPGSDHRKAGKAKTSEARPKPTGRVAPLPARKSEASYELSPEGSGSAGLVERERSVSRRPTIAPPPPPMIPPATPAPASDPFGGGGGWTAPASSVAPAKPAGGPVAFGAVSFEPLEAPSDEQAIVFDRTDEAYTTSVHAASDDAMETEAFELMEESSETKAYAPASKRLAAPSGAKLRAARTKAPANEAPPSKDKADDEPETFERKATVRYYEQMYARHNYPLLIVVSKRSIQKIVKQHVAQVESKKSFKIRRGNPFVTVRPILPGCLCIPAEMTLDVKPKVAEAKFWVTPTAEGVLEDARVEVLYEGKVVSTIPVPTRVTTQTVAKLTGSAAFLSTTAGPFFEAFGISVKKAGASFVADLLADMAGGSMRFGMAGVLAFLALVFFLRRRPKAGPETEGFFDWGVEEEVEGDPLVRAVKAKLVILGPEGRDVVDLVHTATLVGSAETAHVRVRGARSLADVACELRYDDTFVVRARAPGVRVNGEDLREGEERKLGRDGVVTLDSDRVTLWVLDVRQDAATDVRRDEILEALVRARPSFERELRAIWKRTAGEPVRVALLEAVTSAFADPDGWRRVRESLRV